MAMIMNHRVNSYKIAHNRNISPKKIPIHKLPIQKIHFNKKNTVAEPMELLMTIILNSKPIAASVPIQQELSAPPCIVETPTIDVWDGMYDVEFATEELTDEEDDARWAHYDYLEWLCD